MNEFPKGWAERMRKLIEDDPYQGPIFNGRGMSPEQIAECEAAGLTRVDPVLIPKEWLR